MGIELVQVAEGATRRDPTEATRVTALISRMELPERFETKASLRAL